MFGLCIFTLVIATRETNASKVLTLMNGIYFLTIPWQFWKQIRNTCQKKGRQDTSIDGYVPFLGTNENDDSDSMKTSCLNISLLLASILCAFGGAIAFIMFQVS